MVASIPHIGFLAAELDYWRGRARALAARLDEIEEKARRAPYDASHGPAPEPPVGTRYYESTDRGAVLAWGRHDYGWRCSKDGCEYCPASWTGEVADWVARRDYLRCLPGELAPPLAGEVSVEHPEMPF